MKIQNPSSVTLPPVHSALTGSPLLSGKVFFMEVKIGIYKITNPKKHIYIGQSKNIEQRFNLYKYLHCKNQCKLYNSFIKYGYFNHTFEILQECTILELNDLEKYYIKYFKSMDKYMGLNLRSGGNSKVIWSDESKLKASKSKFGFKHTKEARLKMSAANKGKKGRILSPEICKRTGEINRIKRTGKTHSEETKEKMSLSKLGKTKSDETKLRMSIARKGKKMPEGFGEKMRLIKKGIKPSDETKIKMSESAKIGWNKRKSLINKTK